MAASLVSSLCIISTILTQSLCLEAEMNTNQNVFRDEDMIHDRHHLQEHMEGTANIDMDSLDQVEVEFHYFQMHDLDQSQSLDGLEILKAVEHSLYHKENVKDPDLLDPTTEKGKHMFEKVHGNLVSAVDKILQDDDIDHDGYLTYAEFSKGRRSSGLLNLWMKS